MSLAPRKWALWIALVVLIAGGVGAIVYTSITLRHHQEYLSEDLPHVDDLERAKGETITLTESSAGERKWVLKMKQIRYSKNNNEAALVSVQGLLYGPSQKVMFVFEAPSGMFYKQDNRIVLTQGVQMVAPDAKVRITAPQMSWSSKTGWIEATGGVEMTKADFGRTRAQRADFAMDLSQIKFQGNATSVIGDSPPKTGAAASPSPIY